VIQLTLQGDAVFIPVKVVPGASRSAILGEWQGRVRISIAAAPERGKANAELTAFLAKTLGTAKKAVMVTRGTTAPLKTECVRGLSLERIRAALEKK